MLLSIIHAVFAVLAAWTLWSWSHRLSHDRATRTIVTAGLLVRVGAGLLLFVISYWHLPFASWDPLSLLERIG